MVTSFWAGACVAVLLAQAGAAAAAQSPFSGQPPQPLGFAGRWSMVTAHSHFAEAITGPAPEAADLDITRDDGAALAWTLVERDGAAVAASEFGDTFISGKPSNIVVDGVFAPVTVKRVGPHAVDMVSKLGDGASQTIHLELSRPGVMIVDETLVSPAGKTVAQHLEFVRAES
jgi:hypothetical protein